MFVSLNIPLVPTQQLLEDALELGLDCQAGLYDAVFVALARRMKVKVLSADERMASAYAKLDAVELLVRNASSPH